MTNLQIIQTAMALNGVTEEVDTYAGWSRRGYQVQKGERALFKTKIWKPVKGRDAADADSLEKDLILVNASFFGRSQVDNA